MRHPKKVFLILSILCVFACCYLSAVAQTADERNRVANISSNGSSVRWDISVPYATATLVVAAPDGRIFSRDFKGGSPSFPLAEAHGERLPDGLYTFELRLGQSSPSRKDVASNGRGKSDEAESVRAARKSEAPASTLVESGSFAIVNGTVIVAGLSEDGSPRPASKVFEQPKSADSNGKLGLRLNHPARVFVPDQVIPDDLIVQGSLCAGLDCVNNETFGFDTIRLKENNDRLQFDDTSTSAGFATNNWQIRANNSASGGASFLAFVDQGATGNSETGTVVFEVDAGAPANALKVSSAGKVGLRTATPVLDLHITTGDTPAHRLEQTNASGFTAQTWDIAGNEANFFVRDVTSGSRLPFRIRPGAPTSSVDISAIGSVGVGTASPGFALDVQQNSSNNATGTVLRVKGNAAGANDNSQIRFTGKTNGDLFTIGTDISTNNGTRNFQVFDLVGGAARVTVDASGNVGIGTAAPDQKLSVNGDADKTGGNTWLSFSDERLKHIKGRFNLGLNAVMQLQPIRYEYLTNNALGLKSQGEHIGFGAHAVQQVIPEAVTRNSDGYLMVNGDPILWAMLNAIKEQQKQIEQLRGEVRQLRSRRKHR